MILLPILQRIKKQNSLATHNCYAYIADSEGLLQKFSDDGEPQGTAGLPMLEVLKAKKIFKTVAVVTRYFGGIKLGAGGLVRAYTDSGVKAIESTQIVELKEKINISFHIDFQNAFNIYLLTNFGDFSIINRVGNDFVVECDKEKLEIVLKLDC